MSIPVNIIRWRAKALSLVFQVAHSGSLLPVFVPNSVAFPKRKITGFVYTGDECFTDFICRLENKICSQAEHHPLILYRVPEPRHAIIIIVVSILQGSTIQFFLNGGRFNSIVRIAIAPNFQSTTSTRRRPGACRASTRRCDFQFMSQPLCSCSR